MRLPLALVARLGHRRAMMAYRLVPMPRAASASEPFRAAIDARSAATPFSPHTATARDMISEAVLLGEEVVDITMASAIERTRSRRSLMGSISLILTAAFL